MVETSTHSARSLFRQHFVGVLSSQDQVITFLSRLFPDHTSIELFVREVVLSNTDILVGQNMFEVVFEILTTSGTVMFIRNEIYRCFSDCTGCRKQTPAYDAVTHNNDTSSKCSRCRRTKSRVDAPFLYYSLLTLKNDDDILGMFSTEYDGNLDASSVIDAPIITKTILVISSKFNIDSATDPENEVRRDFENSVIEMIAITNGYKYRSKGTKKNSIRYICAQHLDDYHQARQ